MVFRKSFTAFIRLINKSRGNTYFKWVCLICLLVLITGCSAIPSDGPPSSNATLTEPDKHPGLTAQVEIQISTTDSVQIEAVELGEQGRGTVFNKTFAEVTRVSFDKNNVFRKNRAYQITIQVNDSVKWDKKVKHFESYELKVEQDGNVVVESHSIA